MQQETDKITGASSIETRFMNYILLNASFQDQIGLMDGKTAASLFIAELYNKRKEDYLSAICFSFLEEIQSQINLVTPLGFGEGIAGYGCVLEYFNTIGLIQENTSELLEEPDKYILSCVYGGRIQSCGLYSGISGMGMYLLQRLKSITPPSYFQQLRIQEAAIACVDQLNHLWKKHLGEGISRLDISIWEGWPGVILFLNQIQKQGLYEPLTSRLIKEIAETLLKIYTKRKDGWLWEYLDGWFAVFQIDAGSGYLLRYAEKELFEKQIQKAFSMVPALAFNSMAWCALQLSIIAAQNDWSVVGKLGDKIMVAVEDTLNKHALCELYPIDKVRNVVPVGLVGGVCGTALPFISLKTGRTDWLKIFAVEVEKKNYE